MPKVTGRSHASRACDACRRRKVRCLVSAEAAASCKQCLERSAACTYDIPLNKRGPPGKRLGTATSINFSECGHERNIVQLVNFLTPHSEICEPGDSYDSEPNPEGPATDRSSRHDDFPGVRSDELSPRSSRAISRPHPGSPIVSLCSKELMDIALRDYLHLLYPMIPVIHIPSFLRHVESGRQLNDAPFSSLLFSLFALVISMLPRRFEHYKAIDSDFGNEFGHRRQVVDRVHVLILGIQGPDYFDDLTLVKWASTYCRMAAYAYLGLFSRAKMLRAEADTMVVELKCHRIASYAGLDEIEAQLRKKAFWMMMTARIHGSVYELDWDRDDEWLGLENSDLDLLIPHEVDDELITKDTVSTQPIEIPSLTTGFNAEKSLLRCLMPGHKTRASKYSARGAFGRPLDDTRNLPQDLIYLLDEIHPALELWQVGKKIADDAGDSVRDLQCDIQRANLHTTHLWIRSLFLNREAMGQDSTLPADQHADLASTHEMVEDICRQLLHVLTTSSLASLEPHGHALVMKIRQVAANLVDNDIANQYQSDQAKRRTKIYLKKFAAILAELDHNYIDDIQLVSSQQLVVSVP